MPRTANLPLPPARGLVFLAAALALQSFCGCRVFHRQPSDEAVSVARELSLQGMDAQQRGQWDQAEQYYAAAVLRCPQDERARWRYAESLWRRGEQAEAVAHMEAAVRLSGNDPERRVQLGRMYLALGEVHKASVQADKAIGANAQYAAAWALRGDVLRAEGLRSEALASYHRALSYQEHYPEVQLALADLYGQEGRPQRALATLQSLAGYYAPEEVPAEVSYRQGLVLRRLGRHEDAAASLAAAVKCGPATPEMLFELAQGQVAIGDMRGAAESVASGLAIHPNHAGLNRLRGDLESREGAVAAVSDERVIQ